MKTRRTEQEQQIINSVADLYKSAGKGLNKAKRFLRKKFQLNVSENELNRNLDNLDEKRKNLSED